MNILPEMLQVFVTQFSQQLFAWCGEQVYAQLTAWVPEHLLVQVHQQMAWEPLDTACAAFHHQAGPGTPPSYSVAQLLRAMVVKYLYNWSPRQLEEQLRFNLLVKWFCGYSLLAATPDHCTLNRFDLWLGQHHPRLLFEAVLSHIDAAWPQQRQLPQTADTFALQANAAKEDLVPLIRHACRQLLRAWERAAPDQCAAIDSQRQAVALFGPVDEPSSFYLTPAERLVRLQTTARAAQACADWVQKQRATAGPLTPAALEPVTAWLARLDKLWADELIERPATAESPAQLVERTDKGPYRLASATDPEASYRVHGPDKQTLGYNVSLATTADFIREVRADPGAQPDIVALPALLLAQPALPPKLIYDAAAGEGKTRAVVAQATHGQTQLVAPLRPAAARPSTFAVKDFELTADGGLTCPAGQTTHTVYHHQRSDGRLFGFPAGQCQGCRLWAACRSQPADSHERRQVFISDFRAEVVAAQLYNQTADFRADMRQRAQVERIIAGLVRYGGARRAQRHGQAKVDFQVKMQAMAFNLKRWMHLRLCQSQPATAGVA